MPEQIGKILKRIRESKNLSIEEVSERSRIPKHIVSILEEDRFDEIKSIFYVKSFVKTYASFLGALGETAVKEFLARESLKSSSVIASHEVPKQSGSKGHSERSEESHKDCFASLAMTLVGKHKRQILAVAIGIFLFWGVSFAISLVSRFIKDNSTRKQNKIAIVKKEALKEKEKERPKAKDAIKSTKKEELGEKPGFVELEVFALDNTWLQIIGDGELVSTGLFKKGSKDVWRAKKDIKLEVGNSGAIKINVNGKPINFSGKKGEKKEIIITKDGIKN